MDLLKTNRRLTEFTIGFICFGIGQQLTRIGLVEPWAKDTGVLLSLGLSGLILLSVGLFFLCRLLMWLLTHYNQKHRVIKLFGMALGATILGGLVIGFVGQLLSDHSSFSYLSLKNTMWVMTSLFQTLIKVTVITVLASFYQSRKWSWKDRTFQKALLLSGICMLAVTILSLGVPRIATILLYLADAVIVLGMLYYLVKK